MYVIYYWGDHGNLNDDDKGLPENSIMLISGKEFLQEVDKSEKLHFAIVGRPKVILTSTNLNDLPEEIHVVLDNFMDIIVDELPNELPPIRSVSHHIDLIPGASLPNKAAYRQGADQRESEPVCCANST